MQELESLRKNIHDLSSLETEIDSLSEMTSLTQNDRDITKEISIQLNIIENKISSLEFEALFRGEYDSHNVILYIHSGTGGVDAQDWAEMLLRMYLRFCERRKWKTKIISQSRGQEAGIKSVALEIIGNLAYGYLKSEAGVHRLVRLSPFNSNNLRQTSFALVEILPEVDKIEEVKIPPGDLRVDTFRASGAGGQHVNKTDSAVRLTHHPSGITVSCQSERSQSQNKEKALKILQSKLHQLFIKNKAKEIDDIKGEHADVQWGSQIRSYVLHPYKLIKDHRTKFESKNPDEVLDGKLDEFIESYLKTAYK
jgi:peptide chain release factor 2